MHYNAKIDQQNNYESDCRDLNPVEIYALLRRNHKL